MMYAPCCGTLMQDSTKPYHKIGDIKVGLTTWRDGKRIDYDSHFPVWQCPKCGLRWCIERIAGK